MQSSQLFRKCWYCFMTDRERLPIFCVHLIKYTSGCSVFFPLSSQPPAAPPIFPFQPLKTPHFPQLPLKASSLEACYPSVPVYPPACFLTYLIDSEISGPPMAGSIGHLRLWPTVKCRMHDVGCGRLRLFRGVCLGGMESL
jgi:hypothetical protein